MSDLEVFPVLIRMLCSFLSAVGAIAIWSRSRDAAWIMVVLGALFYFIDALYATLVILGVANYSLPFWTGFPLLESALAGLPPLLLAVGFLVFLFRNRRY